MALFWLLSFGLAWALTLPLAASQLGLIHFTGWPAQAAILIGFSPALAATFAARRGAGIAALWKGALRPRGPIFLWVVALALPVALLAIPVVAARAGLVSPPDIFAPPGLEVLAIVWLVLALGEEIGWRGFALPRLIAAHGFWKAATLLGIVWCVWHYPRLLASPYVTDLGEALPLIALFSVQIVLANFILCWLAARTRFSVVLPTIFHAGFNIAATVYPEAATDMLITAAIGVAAAAIALLDPSPAAGPVAAKQEEF